MTQRQTKKIRKQLNSIIYRINISYLSEAVFGKFQVLGKATQRKPNLSPSLDQLKSNVLELILIKQKHKGLNSYSIAWETHQSNGLAHLDILLMYQNRIKKSLSSFDYLLELCPQDLGYFTLKQGQKPQVYLTGYPVTRLNQAIIQYGVKEDPEVLTTFSPDHSTRYLILAQIKADPYRYFRDIMVQDPYNFDLSYYAIEYNLDSNIKGWSSVKSKLNDTQAAARALIQHKKPGIQYITRQLIQQRLTPLELQTFDKYTCFPKIVEFLNQIPSYGPHRPHKTLNLYIYGPKGIGKTSFITEGPTNLAQLVPHYDINLQNKYLNRYYNNVYGFISWNQLKYTDFSPNWVLKLLQGTNLQIPIRYSSNVKRDNPLIIATSNMSFTQHIQRRFKDDSILIQMAKANLINQRIVEIFVPVPMFFLQKLLVPINNQN